MNKENMKAIHSSGDADLLIVLTAIESARSKPTVIANNTNLVILLLHHAHIDGHTILFT